MQHIGKLLSSNDDAHDLITHSQLAYPSREIEKILAKVYEMTKSILTVDDSVSMREMVKFTLTEAGYSVLEAEDGIEALSIAEANDVEAVIADVHMPNMDGISLISRLRALPGYKLMPILMLTTDADSELKQQAADAGATGWLVKPFSPDRLLATVRRVLA